jgi:CCR4-NOT transcription complex subunit 3
MYDKMR